jgi:glycosyltransferase involved in cell wall biosynthesis
VRSRRKLLRVTTVHGWIANDARGRVYRTLDKALLRQFDRVIFVSGAIRRLVPRWWIDDRRARVLYNALVLESYGAQYVNAARRGCGDDGRINILKVGRLSPEKGHGLLLDAFHRVARAEPRLQLLIVGTGPLEAQLREQVQRLELRDQVQFLGFVSDMPPLYARADLIVQSSFTEGLPNVILEGAYLRVPMLATRVGGTDEVMGEGIGGELIEPGSVEELERGLRRFLDDPARFAAMAERAPQRIREHFSFAARTDALSRIYEELV